MTPTGTRPAPLRTTVCGLPDALSVTDSVPWRVPPAVGLKETLIAQLALAASVPPHELVWEKSPVAAMLKMTS
jgi:hypothetical protein